MPHTYSLSDAALQQRRNASAAKLRKRATPAPESIIDPNDADAVQAEILRLFPPIPKDSTMSAHQARNARIRGYLITLGLVQNRGGRRVTARVCRCGTPCASTREARDHCRRPRVKKT